MAKIEEVVKFADTGEQADFEEEPEPSRKTAEIQTDESIKYSNERVCFRAPRSGRSEKFSQNKSKSCSATPNGRQPLSIIDKRKKSLNAGQNTLNGPHVEWNLRPRQSDAISSLRRRNIYDELVENIRGLRIDLCNYKNALHSPVASQHSPNSLATYFSGNSQNGNTLNNLNVPLNEQEDQRSVGSKMIGRNPFYSSDFERQLQEDLQMVLQAASRHSTGTRFSDKPETPQNQ